MWSLGFGCSQQEDPTALPWIPHPPLRLSAPHPPPQPPSNKGARLLLPLASTAVCRTEPCRQTGPPGQSAPRGDPQTVRGQSSGGRSPGPCRGDECGRWHGAGCGSWPGEGGTRRGWEDSLLAAEKRKITVSQDAPSGEKNRVGTARRH